MPMTYSYTHGSWSVNDWETARATSSFIEITASWPVELVSQKTAHIGHADRWERKSHNTQVGQSLDSCLWRNHGTQEAKKVIQQSLLRLSKAYKSQKVVWLRLLSQRHPRTAKIRDWTFELIILWAEIVLSFSYFTGFFMVICIMSWASCITFSATRVHGYW